MTSLFLLVCTAVGMVLLIGASILGAGWTVLWLIVNFPAKPHIIRDTPSFIDAPSCKQNINLLAGVCGRRKPRWFFGLMLLGPSGEQPRRSRIVTTKQSFWEQANHDYAEEEDYHDHC